MGSCHSSVRAKKNYSASTTAAPPTCCSSSSSSVKTSQLRRFQKKKSCSATGGGGGADGIEIPGRTYVNGATRISCLYTQQGKKGTNQDAMLVWENFSSRSDTVFCGVFDGHGPFGHMVSKRVRDSLPLILCTQWKANSSGDLSYIYKIRNIDKSMNSEEEENPAPDMDDLYDSLEAEKNENLPEMYLPLKLSILKAFKLMDEELKLHPTIDSFCSGTTAVTLVKQGQDLVIGNVGDSRAVMATRDKGNSLVAIQLTVDLKPDLPGEAARIQQCKGRVFALQDEPEVARVWLPNNDSPGLAMARAFGDFCLKDFGLISVPDIYYRHLTERDQFIILATDGVWDVLSNKEAVDIVASAPTRVTAARALVDCATRAWKLKYPTSKNDDCAVVCLFLQHDVPSTAAETIAENDIIMPTPDNTTAGDLQVDFGTQLCSGEIVPVFESKEEKLAAKGPGSEARRSLAECISNAEDEDWSALEGIARVNSLVSLPRFLSGDKRSASWRKWL